MSPEAVHKIAGAMVLAFTVLALAKAAGWLHGTWTGQLLPVGILALALFLILDPIVFHGGDFGAEGLQHQLQGALLLGVGGVEVARSRGWLAHRLFGAVLPVVIIVVGAFFVVHDQHGGGDLTLQVVQHRTLGLTAILTGAVKGADGLKLARGNWAAVGWLLLLLVVASQLFLYAERGGAGHGFPTSTVPAPGAHEGH